MFKLGGLHHTDWGMTSTTFGSVLRPWKVAGSIYIRKRPQQPSVWGNNAKMCEGGQYPVRIFAINNS